MLGDLSIPSQLLDHMEKRLQETVLAHFDLKESEVPSQTASKDLHREESSVLVS